MQYGFGHRYPGYARSRRNANAYRDQQLIRIALALSQQIYFMENKPPFTLFIVAINILFYLKPEGLRHLIPSIQSGCLNPSSIVYKGQLSRLFWAPLLHADDIHLYYNMTSLLFKGSQLEPSLGPLRFAALITELSITSSSLYIIIALWLSKKLPYLPLLSMLFGFDRRRRRSLFSNFLPSSLSRSCAVGFSGVLFGLKVILNHNSPGWTNIYGFRLPTKYAAWAELILIQAISPNVSFLGHVCGIFAGILHVYVTRPFIWRRLFGNNNRGNNTNTNRGNRTFYGHGTWG